MVAHPYPARGKVTTVEHSQSAFPYMPYLYPRHSNVKERVYVYQRS
ncbi:hypothetical protein Syn6312_0005 [Synechococcus sp. PCC 6312]|nr:hypothetical protein Syn6312_0005 [Synechococcus sp. PCC 6312]